MKAVVVALLLAACVAQAAGEIYFQEKFDDGWEKRWLKSTWKSKEKEAGEWKWTAGKWFGGSEAEAKGLQTSPDSKFHAISAELKKTVDNTGKELVLQYSVKHEQDLDCGGGYIKLVPASSKSKMKAFGGDVPYSIMFGPDICGYATKKIHVILSHPDAKDGKTIKNHLIKKDLRAEDDQLSHVYTLRLMPNNTYAVYVDKKEVAQGKLEEDWDMLPPAKIKDPKAKKPEDWDERAEIDDPEDKKPEGWDDIPPTIADPKAKKPKDWSDEDDGEWEAPVVPNPEYKGEWKPKRIPNPKYKGLWEAPDIDNPDYKPDDSLYVHKDLKYVAFELWQVKSGSIFDNILVTDDFEAAMSFADETWGAAKDAEKEAFDAAKKKEDEEKKASGGGAGDLGDLGGGLGGGGPSAGGEDEDEYDTEADAGGSKGGKGGEEKKDGEVEKDEL